MKICKGCNIEKPLSEFGYHPENADRKKGKCRACNRIDTNNYRKRTDNACTHKYEKTINGFLMRLYRNMESRITGIQKAKHHLYEGKPLLGRDEFYEWAKNQNEFSVLFSKWEQSGYDRKLTPSVDRIKSNLGYEISNMEWVTHSENSSRGARTKKEQYYKTKSTL